MLFLNDSRIKLILIVLIALILGAITFVFGKEIYTSFTMVIAIIAFFGGYPALKNYLKPRPKLVVKLLNHEKQGGGFEEELVWFNLEIINDGNTVATDPMIRYTIYSDAGGEIHSSELHDYRRGITIPPGAKEKHNITCTPLKEKSTLFIIVSCNEGEWNYSFSIDAN